MISPLSAQRQSGSSASALVLVVKRFLQPDRTSSTAATTTARLVAWAWAPVLPLHARSLTRKAPLAQILSSLAQISTGHG